jgi:WD40 repeat protein
MSNNNKTFLTSVEEKYEDENAFYENSDNEDNYSDEDENSKDPGKSIVNDIMMVLDMDKVFDLQLEFQKAQNGLTIYEFIFVMNRFLDMAIKNNDDATSKKLSRMKEAEKVCALSELFAQIDINGDGTMEWEEFTSYIVESGLNASTEGPTAIQRYQSAKLWEDTSKHKHEIQKMYYFPKTKTIGSIEGNSPVLKLYNGGCQPLNELKAPSGNVLCAEHIPELRQYALTSSDLSLSFFDDSSMRLHKTFHSPVSQMCMTWNAQSKTLYSAGVSGAIYAWDPEKMEEKYHLGGPGRDNRIVKDSHRDMVLCLKSFPTLETLASASMDRTIRLWDTQTGRHRRKLEGHEKGVRALAYNSDHRFMVSGGFDYDALVWNPYVERLILRLHGHTAPLVGVEMVPNTPQIVTGDASGVVKIWDIRTFTCMQTFSHEDSGTNTEMNAFVCLPREQRIVTGARKLRKFDYQKLQNPDLSSDLPVFSAVYNDKLMSFITVTPESVQIWDTKGNLTQTFRDLSEKGVTTMCLDDRERKFLLGDYEGNIKIYDYLSGVYMKKCNYREFHDRAHNGEISNIQYIKKYKCFISTSWDRAISIHDENDAEGGVLLRRIDNAHDADISALDYNQYVHIVFFSPFYPINMSTTMKIKDFS